MSKESGPTAPKQEALLTATDLKQRLVAGELEPGKFIDEIMRMDQSTPGREHALENVEILSSPEVSSIFEKDADYKFSYLNLLSLSYFHRGQIEATEHKDYATALESFKHALEATTAINEEDYQYWKDYVGGTVAYLEKNILELKRICDTIEGGRNRDILVNFLAQLESGDKIDYEAAYSKE
jgi:hypothetical protein